MGQRNADRIPITMRRAQCETVADMAAAGWDVITACRACGLAMAVDLALVARVSGPKTTLWNRKARCRRIGCAGWVDFRAKAPGTHVHETLAADDRLPITEGERARRNREDG